MKAAGSSETTGHYDPTRSYPTPKFHYKCTKTCKFNISCNRHVYKRAENFITLLGEELAVPVFIQERFVSSYFMAELNQLQEIPIPYKSFTFIHELLLMRIEINISS
jgi:hypothetical protein